MYKRSRPPVNVSGPVALSDIFSILGKSFFSCYQLSCVPCFSLLWLVLFHERHVKHTGHIERDTVEMLIVFFMRAENIRDRSCWDPWETATSKAGLVVQSALREVV